FELGSGLPVADFDTRLHATLAELGIDVEIKEEPFGVPLATPFPADAEHASWDGDAIEHSRRILDCSHSVLEQLLGWLSVQPSPGSLAVRPHAAVRTARAPRATLLAFCQGAYEAGARLARWDTSSFESKWCPTPSQLQELQAAAAADLGRSFGTSTRPSTT